MGKIKSGGTQCWVCEEWFWPTIHRIIQKDQDICSEKCWNIFRSSEFSESDDEAKIPKHYNNY